MANETFAQMWSILKENDFQIDDAIISEIMCTSCRNVMIKPCNVPCGCRYCYHCLVSYLNGGDKFCPGGSDDCNNELINIDKNVLLDQAVNIKISRIVVKCPLESCKVYTALGKMANHMRTCDKQPVPCPYFTIGCDKNKISVDKMKLHLEQESCCHARLIVDFVENCRNDMKLLKSNMLDLNEENKLIKEQMESYRKTITTLEENIEKLSQENKSIKELEGENTLQKNQMKISILETQMKLDEMQKNQGQMGTRIDRICQENTTLREEVEIIKLDNKAREKTILALQTKSEGEEQEIRNVKQKCELVEKNQGLFKTRIDKISKENADIVIKSNQSINEIKSCITKLNQVQAKQNCGEFMWCIENFKEELERAQEGSIYSDPFYSHRNGYKICLQLEFGGYGSTTGIHLSLYICIMRGEFDNFLYWPFPHAIKLDLINQETGITHISKILDSKNSSTSSAWKKPVDERNLRSGCYQFIMISQLSSKPALCQGNQVWIKATLEIKP